MKVVLDGTPLVEPVGGIPRYVTQLTRALRERFPEDEFILVSDQHDMARSSLGKRWWGIGLPRELSRLDADVFHGTDFSVPYLPLRPSVMTLHDLSPWMNQPWDHSSPRVRRRTPYLLGLGLATMVITPTSAVRKQAVEHFNLSPSRVIAIPLAAAPEFLPVECRAPAKPYFLYLGTLENRKNLAGIIEAWRELRRTADPDLILVGRRRSGFPLPAAERGLTWMPDVPDDELPALLSGCLACLYPSWYEGFGLPVLEAMQCGAPVIASCDAAVREVSGGAAMHVEAGDARGWLDAMRTLAGDEQLRLRMKERSLARAAQFSWRRTAEMTMEVYKTARGRFGL